MTKVHGVQRKNGSAAVAHAMVDNKPLCGIRHWYGGYDVGPHPLNWNKGNWNLVGCKKCLAKRDQQTSTHKAERCGDATVGQQVPPSRNIHSSLERDLNTRVYCDCFHHTKGKDATV